MRECLHCKAINHPRLTSCCPASRADRTDQEKAYLSAQHSLAHTLRSEYLIETVAGTYEKPDADKGSFADDNLAVLWKLDSHRKSTHGPLKSK